MQVRKKDGQLINDLGQVVCCGNYAVLCGLRCAMFEVRVQPAGAPYAVLHCCGRSFKLREEEKNEPLKKVD